MTPTSPDLRVAERLAAPFSLPGRPAKPLSFRLLPEGGMVVISADGRKLWFTLAEVNTARAELGLPRLKAPARKVEPAPAPAEDEIRVYSQPPGKSRDGQSDLIVLPPDLKHLEQKLDDKIRRS